MFLLCAYYCIVGCCEDKPACALLVYVCMGGDVDMIKKVNESFGNTLASCV